MAEQPPESAAAAAAPPRKTDMRCVHCGATQTPLWRAGPAGPKTLCNACGVRWKKTGSVVPRARRTIAKNSSSTKRSSNHTSSSGGAGGGGGGGSGVTAEVRAPTALRPADEQYESVFAGLMEVPRAARARTRTPRAQLFFDGIARAAAPSPPPVHGQSQKVYVTETLAPSPSPSPPPLPRMEHFPEGGGFRLVINVKPDATAERSP